MVQVNRVRREGCSGKQGQDGGDGPVKQGQKGGGGQVNSQDGGGGPGNN